MATRTDNSTRIVYTTPPKLPPVTPPQQPAQSSAPSGWVDILRWTARIVGLCAAVLLGIILVGDTIAGVEPLGGAIMLTISLFLFFAALLAFISDFLGALLVIGAAASLAYALANGAIGGLIPYVVVFALDGFLFMYCGWRARFPSHKAA